MKLERKDYDLKEFCSKIPICQDEFILGACKISFDYYIHNKASDHVVVDDLEVKIDR